ncbi:MAG: hypothetical protein N3A38_02320 [Planctomycetota bacterium]|nr:hypothetical protein [Planctomycetota bacterium]
MSKSVLIITPFFAPQTHAAVFRAYKLAKYLPRLGWKPYVVTTDINYLYNEDPSLLEALPPEVEIVRARYVEPTMRGLRMALGGRDRTFKALKAAGLIKPSAGDGGGKAGSRGPLARAYDYLRERFLNNPDAYWTWKGPALRAAKALIERCGIRLVYTTCIPYTCNLIGRKLQRMGCRWVADFRDPAGCSFRVCSQHHPVFIRQRRIIRMTLEHADAITGLSSMYGPMLEDSFGIYREDGVYFITTGLDEELLPPPGSPPPREDRYIIFSGEYLREYGDWFLRVFAAAAARPEVAAPGVKLLIVGRREINEPLVAPHAKRLGIEGLVEFVDHVPQRELYRLIGGAMACVLLGGVYNLWWCLFAKLVDYIAMRKPVLAMVPDPSEARTRLTRAGLGIFLDGPEEAAAGRLGEFLLGRGPEIRPDAVECAKYTAESQALAFAGVFEKVLSRLGS